jgi:hypothetical protein
MLKRLRRTEVSAVTSTTTELSEIRNLLNTPRDVYISKMTPERRALYERIVRRRDNAGAVVADLEQALMELRNDG